MAEFLVGAAFFAMRGFLSMNPDDLGAMIMVLGNAIIFTIVMHYKGLNDRDLFHWSPSSAKQHELRPRSAGVLVRGGTSRQ